MAVKKIAFADFELDFARFQLFHNGNALRLEGLPLQLLMLLVERRSQLVTREEIADVLWGKDVFVDVEQGINTAIRKVRRVLEDDSDQPIYLQTVVGKGYRFIGQVAEDAGGSASDPFSEPMFSAEELGRAIMTAAGLDPDNPTA